MNQSTSENGFVPQSIQKSFLLSDQKYSPVKSEAIHKRSNSASECIQKKLSKKPSPTRKLIDFQKKRNEMQREIAKELKSHRSFERLLVYSNNPKFNLETSLKKLEIINTEDNKNGTLKLEGKVEKSLAKELLPSLKEAIEMMNEKSDVNMNKRRNSRKRSSSRNSKIETKTIRLSLAEFCH